MVSKLFSVRWPWDRNLPLNPQTTPLQLSRQNGFVDGFQQTEPKLGMDFHSGVDDFFGDLVFVHVDGFRGSRNDEGGRGITQRRKGRKRIEIRRGVSCLS